MQENKGKIGYLCSTDYEFELESAAGGVKIFSSINDLKKNRKCWEECGIIEVEIVQKKVIVEGEKT